MTEKTKTATINMRDAMLSVALITSEAVLAAGGVAAFAMGLVLLLG